MSTSSVIIPTNIKEGHEAHIPATPSMENSGISEEEVRAGERLADLEDDDDLKNEIPVAQPPKPKGGIKSLIATGIAAAKKKLRRGGQQQFDLHKKPSQVQPIQPETLLAKNPLNEEQERQLEQLEKKIQEALYAVQDSDEKIVPLREAINQLQKDLQNASAQLLKVRQKKDEIESTLKNLVGDKRHERWEAQARLEGNLRQLQNSGNMIRAKVTNVTGEEIARGIQALRGFIDNVESDALRATKKIVILDNDLQALEQPEHPLRQTLQECDGQSLALGQEINDINQKIADSERVLQGAQQSRQSIWKNMIALEVEAAPLHAVSDVYRLEQAKQELERIQQARNSLQNKTKEMQEYIDRLNGELAGLPEPAFISDDNEHERIGLEMARIEAELGQKNYELAKFQSENLVPLQQRRYKLENLIEQIEARQTAMSAAEKQKQAASLQERILRIQRFLANPDGVLLETPSSSDDGRYSEARKNRERELMGLMPELEKLTAVPPKSQFRRKMLN